MIISPLKSLFFCLCWSQQVVALKRRDSAAFNLLCRSANVSVRILMSRYDRLIQFNLLSRQTSAGIILFPGIILR